MARRSWSATNAERKPRRRMDLVTGKSARSRPCKATARHRRQRPTAVGPPLARWRERSTLLPDAPRNAARVGVPWHRQPWRGYIPSQPSNFSRSSTQERSTFPAMVAAIDFSSARCLAIAAA
jgi:hypothetical protein